jgi:hypothetical protein
MIGFRRTASMASALVIQASCQAMEIENLYILHVFGGWTGKISRRTGRMENLRFAQLLCGAQ